MIELALAIHVVAVLVVIAAFFVHRPWLRPTAVVLAAIAICLPYYVLRMSLGRPNPKVIPGRYEMYSRKQDAKNGVIYILVGERGSDWPPRLFSMPMKARQQVAADRGSSGRNYDVIDITIAGDDGMQITYNDEEYELPDANKEAYYQRLRERPEGQ